MPEFSGSDSNDQITGTNDADIIHGNLGNDIINGLDGDDIIYGGGTIQQLDPNGITVTNGTTARVELESIAKGFHNAVGMYKVGSDGTIYDVQIIYAPDGSKGGGKGLEPNTVLNVDVAAGEQLGFFVLGNGYGNGALIDAINDPNATFELRTKAGDPGLIVDTDLQLWQVDTATGSANSLASGEGHDIVHSLGTAENGYAPNADGVQHAVAVVDMSTGTVKLGLEAQKNGGNLDFDDAVISIELGQSNIEGLEGATSPLNGPDDDIIDAGSGNDTVFGQKGNDRLDGGSGDDRLFGGSGDDRILGGDGADFIKGNSGDDVIDAGADNDEVSGGKGNDEVAGGSGDDIIRGDSGNDRIEGGVGADIIKGGTGNDVVSGGDDGDVLSGGKGNDAVAGDKGDDVINGDTGDDVIDGGAGDDAIKGGEDNDAVTGGEGNDNLSGGMGADHIDGGSGDDIVFGDSGDDTVRGGDGNDQVKGGEGNDHVYGDAGDDTITGGKGDDVLDGGTGNDTVLADSGNDTIIASAGTDYYDGGSDIDAVDYSAATGPVTVDLEAHTAASDLGNDTIWSVENVIGSAQADLLTGDKRVNHLSGGEGNDVLRGGRENDTLEGGSGTDTFAWALKDVIGTEGTDSFVDTIIDFDGDILDLSGLVDVSGGQSVSDVVALSDNGADTLVAVYNAAEAAWLDVAVLENVTGLDVTAMETSGQIVV